MIYDIKELLALARAHSPFYRELYRHLPAGDLRLRDVPVLDQALFWQANNLQENRVLTGPVEDGVIYKSGGTTGSPKFSFFTRDEWRSFTQAFGRGMNAGGLKKGDRVANLFYAGELYASFLFITSSIESAPEPAVLLPVSGATAPADIAHIITELGANVIAGVPTTILKLAEYLLESGLTAPRVDRILYGGESMYPDQRRFLSRIFPGAEIRSIGYASVDAGLLGYADLTCGPDEHRVFGAETIVELIDEDTGESITEADRPGKVVITNLTRALMPIIRYPAGDRAVWSDDNVDSTDRKFRLLGRSEEGARIGPATLYFDDVAELLAPFSDDLGLQGFQILIAHDDCKDQLILRIAAANAEAARSRSEGVIQKLLSSRPMLTELIEKSQIHRPRIEWVRSSDLAANRRTGKVRRILDQRSG